MMRGNLEAHLMYSTPSELLIADPISKASRRLLGSFSQAVQGLKAESLPKEKYGQQEAHNAILDFYASGAFSSPVPARLSCPPFLPRHGRGSLYKTMD